MEKLWRILDVEMWPDLKIDKYAAKSIAILTTSP
jgi:hypothetical protein